MKKIMLILLIGILVISGYNASTYPNEVHQEKIILHFSQLTINENDNYVDLELKGTNSILVGTI
jgi:hypothetical protein